MGGVSAAKRPMLMVCDHGDGPDPDAGPADRLVGQLTMIHDQISHGYGDISKPPTVYGFDPEGKPFPLAVEVERTPFDSDHWSYGAVTVTWPDGATVQGNYRVDGRS